MRNSLHILAAAALLLGAAACDDNPTYVVDGPDGGGSQPGAPSNLRGSYAWVLEGFNNGQPVGYNSVQLTWRPPTSWNSEPFRVYGKRSGSSNYSLVATVTSCTTAGCSYVDRNVASATTYEYYVATVNQNTDRETNSDTREIVAVPAASTPAAPQLRTPVALDNAVYLSWAAGGANVGRYRVYLTRINSNASYLYPTGESDGNGYVDLQAENGAVYGYRVAAVDTLGRVSALSPEVTAVPRPDRTSELVYGFQDNAAQSGYRYNLTAGTASVVSGSAADAHWRLERDNTGWRIVPLNGVRIADAGRTTSLACGPASGPECSAVTVAPSTGYVSTGIAIAPEVSYVLAIPTASGGTQYGVVRVQLLGNDQSGRALMVFDWSLQLRAGETRLDRAAR